jgi:hypothetical protein
MSNNLAYGPLSNGVEIKANSGTPAYQVNVQDEMRKFSQHPLSPDERQEWGHLLAMAGKETGAKANTSSVAHPPIIYKPSESKWETGEDLRCALLYALQLSGTQVTAANFAAPQYAQAAEKLMEIRQELYHPCDREALSPFHDEHRATCWTRSSEEA